MTPPGTARRAVINLFAFSLAITLLSGAVRADLSFPALTGRVVDLADLLDPSLERQLAQKLEAHEQSTSNQVIVVTVQTLQGYSIEDFGYQLGRHWGIGQKGRDNGAILIVAPNERAVRIEVGYGFEGSLPDALAKTIVDTEILPAFRKGNYSLGIAQGVDAILAAIAGEYAPIDESWSHEITGQTKIIFAEFLILLALLGLALLIHLRMSPGSMAPGLRRDSRDYSGGNWRITSGGGGGGYSGGGGSFSGGGGSFGGGGASGRW